MPVTSRYYAVARSVRRIPHFLELWMVPLWQEYESAKVMVAEIDTWDMRHADPEYATRVRNEAQQIITRFETQFPNAEYRIQEVWEYALMPPYQVVKDFCKVWEFGDLQKNQALWERLTTQTLDEVIPGETVRASAQWMVTLPSNGSGYSLTWMIYEMDGGPIYVYENITPPDEFGPGDPAIERGVLKRTLSNKGETHAAME